MSPPFNITAPPSPEQRPPDGDNLTPVVSTPIPSPKEPPTTQSLSDERFTLSNGGDGVPITRTVLEMTVDDVLLALEWQASCAERLREEARSWEGVGTALESDPAKLERLVCHLTEAEVAAGIAKFVAFAEAQSRGARLLSLIRSAIPAWQEQSTMPLGVAIREYWPRVERLQ